MRQAKIERKTQETAIDLLLTLDGSRRVSVNTGWGFADHMLSLISFWAGWDLELECRGDLEVDAHHSLEDIGLSLGQAIAQAAGDKSKISRIGSARVPMDEALADVVLDISGRPYLIYHDAILPGQIGGQETDVWREFFKSLAFKGGLNLHIRYLYGRNGHHLLESACKGLGIALSQGLAVQAGGILSTKGALD